MLKLEDPVSKVSMVGPMYVSRLEKLGIETVGDLIYHIPNRYQDFRLISEISKVRLGEIVTIRGEITFIKNIYTKSGKKMQIGEIADGSGKMNVIWFNQPYLIRALRKGTKLSLSGKIGFFWRKKSHHFT